MSCLSLSKEESLQRTFSAEDCVHKIVTNIRLRTDAEDFSKCINGKAVCKKCIRIDFQYVNDYYCKLNFAYHEPTVIDQIKLAI